MTNKTYNYNEVARLMRQNGYQPIRTTGSHIIWSNGVYNITINKNINKMVLRRLVKTYDLRGF